jgi:hypothetical protein
MTGSWRRLHDEELNKLYDLSNIITMSKSRRMVRAGQVARMGTMRNLYILVGKPDGKRPLGRPRRTWEDNIRMDVREMGWEGVDWIHLAQDGDQ